LAVAISRLTELLAMERALKASKPGEDDATSATLKRRPLQLPPEIGRDVEDMLNCYAEWAHSWLSHAGQ
jgi:hypothetical protein